MAGGEIVGQIGELGAARRRAPRKFVDEYLTAACRRAPWKFVTFPYNLRVGGPLSSPEMISLITGPSMS